MKKNKLILIISIGAAAILLLLILILVMTNRSNSKNQLKTALSGFQAQIIPAEELFLPSEPDFIPEILFEREKRAIWTHEDASQYWQDPLKNGEEFWRQNTEKIIDELMEHVP